MEIIGSDLLGSTESENEVSPKTKYENEVVSSLSSGEALILRQVLCTFGGER